jgi:hypothetical protein
MSSDDRYPFDPPIRDSGATQRARRTRASPLSFEPYRTEQLHFTLNSAFSDSPSAVVVIRTRQQPGTLGVFQL